MKDYLVYMITIAWKSLSLIAQDIALIITFLLLRLQSSL